LGVSAAGPGLDGHDLEVVGAEGHAEALPGGEVVLEGHGAAGAGGLTDAVGRVSLVCLFEDVVEVAAYEMYCWKVEVPWMEGWLVCWCCQTS